MPALSRPNSAVSAKKPALGCIGAKAATGLAGGERKIQAIRGAMKGGYLDVLITDLDTAVALENAGL